MGDGWAKYTIEISAKARKKLQLHYKSGNFSDIRNIKVIFQELLINPYKETGNPEAFKYKLMGYLFATNE